MIRDRIEALVRELLRDGADDTPDDTDDPRWYDGYAAACRRCADRLTLLLAEEEGGWRPIETAPIDRPILWCEHAGSPVSVIDIDDYGECYLTPGSLWHEIPEPTPGPRP